MKDRSRRRYELKDAALNRDLEALVARAAEIVGHADDTEYVRQILVTALRFLDDSTSTGDVKLVNSALKELRHAFRVFAPYRHVRKVAVFGSARTQPEERTWQQARDFAERIVREGWMVITGAGDGIMGAAQGGAGRRASFGVNIRLPFEQQANETIAGDSKLINFKYFFTRKVTFVKEAHAIALFPGGYGTHDEGFEALTLMQTGRSEILPVVFVDSPGGSYWKDWRAYVDSHLRARDLIDEDDLSLFKVTDDVDAAVREIRRFYRNYHSSRFARDRLMLRVRIAPGRDELEELNDAFADLTVKGRIELSDPLPEEEGEAAHLARIALHFDRRKVGRLRKLIDRLNGLVAEPSSPREASPHHIVEIPGPAPEDEER